jgi:hypothetical protein
MINKLKKVLKDGHEKINKRESEREESKIGFLRAGSSGAIVNSTALYTDCGRKAQARLLGYSPEPTEELRLMFNCGLTLENYIETRLQAAGIDYGKEEEITRYFDDIGYISGRPDFEVFLEEKGVRKLIGIEVKSFVSPFSVIKQRKNDFPMMKHLIQAATYMMMTNRDEWYICIGHFFYVNQNGKKHNPALVWYELKKNGDGKLTVTNEKGRFRDLPFDFSNILSYYKEVRNKTDAKQLMDRPTEMELNVDTYNRCNYCPMKSACNEYEAGQLTFEQWLEKVKITKES